MVEDTAAFKKNTSSVCDIVLSAVNTIHSGHAVQMGTLMNFHERFGHVNYDTIKRLARTPDSGI